MVRRSRNQATPWSVHQACRPGPGRTPPRSPPRRASSASRGGPCGFARRSSAPPLLRDPPVGEEPEALDELLLLVPLRLLGHPAPQLGLGHPLLAEVAVGDRGPDG